MRVHGCSPGGAAAYLGSQCYSVVRLRCVNALPVRSRATRVDLSAVTLQIPLRKVWEELNACLPAPKALEYARETRRWSGLHPVYIVR